MLARMCPAFATEGAIDGERQPDRKPVHAAPGTARLIALDDEVPMVLLDGKVDHAETIERSARDGAAERPKHPGRSKRRQPRRPSNRDLHGVPRVDLRPRVVRHRRSTSWLSPGTLPLAAPLPCHLERQRHLPPSYRFDSAHVRVVGAARGGLRGFGGT
jgi:hypothetical protein